MQILVKYHHFMRPNKILEMVTYGVNREAAENQADLELGLNYDIIDIQEVDEETL